jgi:hypothetical protein
MIMELMCFDYNIELNVEYHVELIKLSVRVPMGSYLSTIDDLHKASMNDKYYRWAIIIDSSDMKLTTSVGQAGRMEVELYSDKLNFELYIPEKFHDDVDWRNIHYYIPSSGTYFELRIYINNKDIELIKRIVKPDYISIQYDDMTQCTLGSNDMDKEIDGDTSPREVPDGYSTDHLSECDMTRVIISVPRDYVNKLKESAFRFHREICFTPRYKDIIFLDVDENQHALGAICDAMKAMLMSKNRNYGDVASNPINVYNRQDALQSILARLDDKLARIKHSDTLRINDVADVAGYNMLLLSIIGTAQDILDMID